MARPVDWVSACHSAKDSFSRRRTIMARLLGQLQFWFGCSAAVLLLAGLFTVPSNLARADGGGGPLDSTQCPRGPNGGCKMIVQCQLPTTVGKCAVVSGGNDCSCEPVSP
jgi:hypothetical protein